MSYTSSIYCPIHADLMTTFEGRERVLITVLAHGIDASAHFNLTTRLSVYPQINVFFPENSRILGE